MLYTQLKNKIPFRLDDLLIHIINSTVRNQPVRKTKDPLDLQQEQQQLKICDSLFFPVGIID